MRIATSADYAYRRSYPLFANSAQQTMRIATTARERIFVQGASNPRERRYRAVPEGLRPLFAVAGTGSSRTKGPRRTRTDVDLLPQVSLRETSSTLDLLPQVSLRERVAQSPRLTTVSVASRDGLPLTRAADRCGFTHGHYGLWRMCPPSANAAAVAEGDSFRTCSMRLSLGPDCVHFF